MNRRPPVLSAVARAVAILFAIFVVACLVVNAQRNADRAAQEPMPDESAPESEGFLHSSKSAAPAAPPFLPSSKIGAPGLTPPPGLSIGSPIRWQPAAEPPATSAPRKPNFLPSSKTITPLVTPPTPVLVFPVPKPTATERPQR